MSYGKPIPISSCLLALLAAAVLFTGLASAGFDRDQQKASALPKSGLRFRFPGPDRDPSLRREFLCLRNADHGREEIGTTSKSPARRTCCIGNCSVTRYP